MDDNSITDLAGLIHGIAAEVCSKYGCWDKHKHDLVGEGYLALVKSATRFDPDKGDKLGTFAWQAIKGAMYDYLRKENFKGCQVSRADRDLAKNVRRAHDELAKRLRRQPSNEDIAEHLNIEVKSVEAALELLAFEFESLAVAEPEEQETSWEPRAIGLTPEEGASLRYEIERLPENYREVFTLRHIVGLSEQETAKKLGKPIGTVKSDLSRARSMLKQALPQKYGWR